MSKEDLIEKAKHQVGDVHPKWSNLVWTDLGNGKFDWRSNKSKSKKTSQAGGQVSSSTNQPQQQDNNGGETTQNQPQQQQNNQPQQQPQQSEMPDVSKMTHKELVDWARKTKEEALLSVVNSKSAPSNFRQIAYDELKNRNVDVSKIDTTDIDVGYQKKKAKVQYKSAPSVEIKIPNKYTIKLNSGKTKDLTASGQAKVYANLDESELLKVLNNPKGNAYNRHLAYEEAASRGIDESKINTSGSLQELWDNQKTLQNITNSSNDDDDDDESGVIYTQPWLEDVDVEKISKEFLGGDDLGYLNPEDRRIKTYFHNLNSLRDRQQYDAFVDYMKRQDPNYVSSKEQLEDLNAEYLDFLDGDATSFLISAGGAGVGKTWGFKKLCELLNLREFDPETMSPGDDDYDWVVAPNIKSEKQLQEFLKRHNGKIILFDDNDAVLTRQDMKAIMKTVNDNDPKSRLFKDPNTGQMIRFTGKIACITNKSLDSLADDEDGRAVVSRAKKLEVKMTVEENLEILKERYASMEIDGLDLGSDESKIRKEVYQFIVANKDKLDPAKFTVRKFRDIMLDIQKERRRSSFSGTSSLAASLLGKGKDWRKVALANLNKAKDDEFQTEDENEELGFKRPSEKVKDKIEKLKKKNPKLANQLFGEGVADHDDSDLDNEEEDNDDETEKAYQIDFGDMSLKDAENLLLS